MRGANDLPRQRAAVAQQRVRVVDDVRLRLAVVQPGEQVSVFNDALSQLSGRLTYLYRKDRRYWYDTRTNLWRTVEERAQQFPDDEVESERRIREAPRRDRGDLKGVHACPPTCPTNRRSGSLSSGRARRTRATTARAPP